MKTGNPHGYEPGFTIENHRDELIERLGDAIKRINELESQVAAYHAAAARVAGDALRARQDALEEAAKLADKMQDAAGLILARGHDDDAATQHDVAKEIAEAIRALSGPEWGTK